MKVSKYWLNEFVPCTDLYDLADRFSLHSQEVESVSELTSVNNLTIGYVKECVDHPDSNKLHVCQVDVGTSTLQIVCGAPNVSEGQKVIVATTGAVLPNGMEIQPVTLRGVESNGMICSLVELGVDKKFADGSGIEVLPADAPVGEEPLSYLHLNTTVMELDLTPNRADLLSMMGVAYDAAAFYKLPVTLPTVDIAEIEEENPMEIVLDTDKCLSYYTRVIKDVEIKESPQWLKASLIAAGMRPINNVVDITNYIMLETGQPLHAFDLDKFQTHKVVVRMAHESEKLVTLDDKTRTLTTDDIVITNGEFSTGLGGVMGGFNTEIDETTKYVLLESASFHPTSIRKTSRRLDLRSDASMRFEKGIDPNRTLLALERATYLFQELASGKVLKDIRSTETRSLSEQSILITNEYIVGALGVQIASEDILGIFKALHFEASYKEGTFTVSVPTRRQDIETKQDLIEELARIYGYDNIPNTLPSTVSKGSLTHRQEQLRQVRRELNGLGLDETITYSLVNLNELNRFTLEEEPGIKLMMPMSEDKAVLRQSLLNGLTSVISYNEARRQSAMAFFELGATYQNPQQQHLAAALSGVREINTWNNLSIPYDFYYTKGVLDAALDVFGVKATYEASDLGESYHPGQSAKVLVGGTCVGFIAKIHPKLAKELSLPSTYVFELNLDLLPKEHQVAHFSELAKYPTVERDLAIQCKRDVSAASLISLIETTTSNLLKDIVVFDRYTGENVEQDEQSIALKLYFNSPDKTLESKEVQDEIDQVVQALKVTFDAKLRD